MSRNDDREEPTPLGDIVPHLDRAKGMQPEHDPDLDPRRGVDEELMAEHRERQRGHRLEMWHRLVPQRYRDADLPDLDDAGLNRPDVERLRTWSGDPDRNLVLLGPVGTGKTHLAWACMREPYLSGRSVYGGSLLRVLDQMRPGQDGGWDLTGIDPVRRPSATERLCTDDVAFLDDLGVERATEWTMQQVHRILDDRHADMLPTVVTSNLEPADLKTALGEATYSRLIGSGAIVLRLAGDDRRRGKRS